MKNNTFYSKFFQVMYLAPIYEQLTASYKNKLKSRNKPIIILRNILILENRVHIRE